MSDHVLSTTAVKILGACPEAWRETRMTWATPVTPAAAHKGRKLLKVTTAIVRLGVGYADRFEVQEAIEAGKRGEVEKRRWGRWVLYPYIIVNDAGDREYLQVTPSDDRPKSTYYVDDMEVDRETFDGYLTPGARKPKVRKEGQARVFDVPVENIRSIGRLTLAA